MSKGQIVTGLDVGTHTIKVLVAQRNGKELELLAYSQIPSFGLRKGTVASVEETAKNIQHLISGVERDHDIKISSVFVNINGSHLYTTPSDGLISVSRADQVISQEDVDRTLETIRKQRATWNPVERAARLGDRVKIDFVGRLNGKEFEGGKADAFPLVLGSGTLIESLEQGLVGAKPGETHQVAAKFPADYRHALLAGQTADFDVKVIDVAEAVLPEINEALAKELGVKEASIENLRQEVKANLEREAANRARTAVRTRALKSLLEVNPFDVPQSLLAAEIGRLKTSDKTAGSSPGDEAAYERRARIRVALGVILGEIIRSRGLSPDPVRVRARIEEMAAEYESPQEFISWHYEKPERLSEMEGLVMEERVVEDLLVSAEVIDQAMSFQELLKVDIVLQ